MAANGSVQRGLVPFLDTLFILLFALLALSDTKQSHRSEKVSIDLPAVESDPQLGATPEGSPLIIEIDAESRVLWSTGDVLEGREALDERLAVAIGDAVPDSFLIEIHADQNAAHGVVVDLLQHLRLLGFVQVQLLATSASERTRAWGDPQ